MQILPVILESKFKNTSLEKVRVEQMKDWYNRLMIIGFLI